MSANRSRIVVDLNPPPPAPPASRRGGNQGGSGLPPSPYPQRRSGCRRALGVLALVFLVGALGVLAGGYLWWRSFQRSPAYSLALIADAARRGDDTAFDSLVDSDQVTLSFLPQVRERATGSTRQLPPAVERQVDSAIEQQLPNIRPVVRERLRQTIANLTGAAGVEVPFPALVLAIRALVGETREEGDVMIVPLRTNSNQPTELAMRRREDRWQLVGVRDPSITAALAAELPTALPTFTPGSGAPSQNLLPRRR